MRGTRGIERDLAPLQDRLRSAVMGVCGRQEREGAVAVLPVIPSKEGMAEDTRLREIGKCCRKLGLILGGLEERFDVRVVVADVGSRMALGYAQIGEQKGDGLGGHRATAIGVHDKLRGIGTLLGNGLGQQDARKRGAFAIGDHPADNVPAIDVDDRVEVKVGPLLRAVQLGDVPGKNLARPRRAKLGFYVCRARRLIAPFTNFADTVQDAVLRRHRAMIDAFVPEGGVDIRDATIDESRFVNSIQDRLPFSLAQCQR